MALADLAALTRRLQAALPPGQVLQCYPELDSDSDSPGPGGPGQRVPEPMRSLEQLFAQAACADVFLRDKVPQRLQPPAAAAPETICGCGRPSGTTRRSA